MRLLLALGGITLGAVLAPVAATAAAIAYDNADLRYSIRLPDQCRHIEGPGTLEAICATDLDAEKSKTVATAGAFVMEIDAETVPAGAVAYAEAEFRREVPESVCGEAETGKVRIGAVATTVEGPATSFSAEIVCPAIRFLGLPERKAIVRYLIGPGHRYRLMVRAPAEDLETLRPVGTAFLDSFKIIEEKKP